MLCWVRIFVGRRLLALGLMLSNLGVTPLGLPKRNDVDPRH
jgi:hypothetical protein